MLSLKYEPSTLCLTPSTIINKKMPDTAEHQALNLTGQLFTTRPYTDYRQYIAGGLKIVVLSVQQPDTLNR
jgi:hypothetical protein